MARYFKKRRGLKKVFKSIKRVQKSVKSLKSAIETKHYDEMFPAMGISQELTTSGLTIGILDGLSQGVADGFRISNKIKVTSIQLCYQVQAPLETSIVDDLDVLAPVYDYTARVLLAQDKNPKLGSSDPSITELLDLSLFASNPGLALKHPEYKKRWRVIHDQTHILSPPAQEYLYGGTTDQAGAMLNYHPLRAQVKKNFRKLNIPVEWISNASFATNKAFNGLYLFAVSSSGAASPPNPTIRYFWRIKYQDA